ncbi:MAG TPA: L,D-transpeptidase [Aquihabitans sp.]|nr:L,D-transpeptidase [Aquihabitans sp.]
MDRTTPTPTTAGDHRYLASGVRRRRRTVGALALAGLVLLAGCGGSPAPARDAVPRPAPTTAAPSTSAAAPTATTTTTTVAAADRPARPRLAERPLAVRADGELQVRADPADATASEVLPARNAFGSPTALLVLEVGAGANDGWFRVLLPGRPNGRTGWVDGDAVRVHEVAHRVQVDLAARTLVVRAGDDVVLTTPVAVGDAEHPTPTGTFSLTDKLATGRPDGPYGPFALGLSARSDVLTEFAGGDGQVGIHGTDDPSSIGRAASHGCIRVPNEVAEALSELLALGTPVTVA